MPVAQITTYPFGIHDRRPIELLEANGFTVRPSPHGRKHTSTETAALLGDIDVLIAGTEALTADLIAQGLPRLRHIAKVGVGLDGVDIRACMAADVALTYTPDAPARSVVEQVFGQLICLGRRFIEAHEGLRRGEWLRLTGTLWQGKTLGILGCGRIGKQVAVIARAFGMQVLAHDIHPDRVWAERQQVRYVDLETLLSRSDAVTCHLPLTRRTRHLLDAERLALLQPHALLLNTSRGACLDEDALLQALTERRIAGAAIDVYQREPYSGPLARCDNVLLTCHQGSCSFDGRLAMELGAAENAVALWRSERPASDRIVWLPGMSDATVDIDELT